MSAFADSWSSLGVLLLVSVRVDGENSIISTFNIRSVEGVQVTTIVATCFMPTCELFVDIIIVRVVIRCLKDTWHNARFLSKAQSS